MTLDHLPVESVLLVAAGLMVIGVLIVGASDRLRVPAALLSLGIGMVFGSDVLGFVDVSDMAMVRDISVIALMIILFEGGLTTKPSVLRESGVPGFVLANVGVLVSAGVVAAGVQLLFDSGWETALIIGAVVASTDAAVVFDVVRRTPIPKRLAGILEIESGVNDPFAILLTIGLIEVTRSNPGVEDWLVFGARQLFGGMAVGLLGGWIGARLLRLRLRSSGLYPLLALAMAGLTFAVASYLGSSGFLAVYICGLMIGALAPRHRRVVRSFHASLANGADIALFLLLGLLVFPAELPEVGNPGVGGDGHPVTGRQAAVRGAGHAAVQVVLEGDDASSPGLACGARCPSSSPRSRPPPGSPPVKPSSIWCSSWCSCRLFSRAPRLGLWPSVSVWWSIGPPGNRSRTRWSWRMWTSISSRSR